MKFLADESVDFPIIKSLREIGFDVSYLTEMYPGVTDVEVIEIAGNQSRILITADKDFGTLIFRNKLI